MNCLVFNSFEWSCPNNLFKQIKLDSFRVSDKTFRLNFWSYFSLKVFLIDKSNSPLRQESLNTYYISVLVFHKRNRLIFYFYDCFSHIYVQQQGQSFFNIPASDCQYEYRDCSSQKCSLSSQGYPGIYRQDSKCLYHLQHQRVRLSLHTNLPTDRM